MTDIVGGLLVVAVGVFAVLHAQQYAFGNLQRMGPGFFPTAIGILLIVLGIFITLPAAFRAGPSIQIHWKGCFWVLLSIFAFAYTLDDLGLPLAAIAAVIAATGASTLPWSKRLILGVAVAAITYLIFILGLGMNMPVFPSFQ
jgi:hypothetical protein